MTRSTARLRAKPGGESVSRFLGMLVGRAGAASDQRRETTDRKAGTNQRRRRQGSVSGISLSDAGLDLCTIDETAAEFAGYGFCDSRHSLSEIPAANRSLQPEGDLDGALVDCAILLKLRDRDRTPGEGHRPQRPRRFSVLLGTFIPQPDQPARLENVLDRRSSDECGIRSTSLKSCRSVRLKLC